MKKYTITCLQCYKTMVNTSIQEPKNSRTQRFRCNNCWRKIRITMHKQENE